MVRPLGWLLLALLLPSAAAQVSCGAPSQFDPNANLTACQTPAKQAFGGVCAVVCNTGYTGSPNATCASDGTWLYSGQCDPVVNVIPDNQTNQGTPMPQNFQNGSYCGGGSAVGLLELTASNSGNRIDCTCSTACVIQNWVIKLHPFRQGLWCISQ